MQNPDSAATSRTGSSTLPALELIRGVAALEVLVAHIFLVLMFHSRVKMAPSLWKLDIFDWSYQSVIVFFVLSGLVIGLSQDRKHRPFSSFMRARFRRLMPLYLIALTFSFGIEWWLHPPCPWRSLIGHLFFIQGSSWAPMLNVNAPLWSLGYEFYFYLIFACTIGMAWWSRTAWFVLGLAALVLELAGIQAPGVLNYFQTILAFSPIWLLGTLLLRRPIFAGTSPVQSLGLIGLLPLAIGSLSFLGLMSTPAHSLVLGLLVAPLLYCGARVDSSPEVRPSSLSWILLATIYTLLAISYLSSVRLSAKHTDAFFALIYPFVFLSIVPFYRLVSRGAPFFSPRVRWFSLGLGRMSYAIYIIHFPILSALGAVMLNPWLEIAADLALVIPLAWWLEYRAQPVLAAWFDCLWPEDQAARANRSPGRSASAEIQNECG